MKALIVAKTRRGMGACVGGITADGRSVRLIAHDHQTNERAGLEYTVGDVWELEVTKPSKIIPPHVEDIVVWSGHRLRSSTKLNETILRFMPPATGGLDKLFDGLTQVSRSGGLYVCERTGLPPRSTMFWIPDEPLVLDCSGKRLHYCYGQNGPKLAFVGFQEPVQRIPAGALLRISLAHKWRPDDKPDQELRCHLQLSGWIGDLPQTPKATGYVRAEQPPLFSIDPLQVLKSSFGYSEFNPLQREVIQRVLQKKDSLVVMPTGGGKSLCYQLPALILDGLTVVVSPLIALMQDQVRQLHDRSIVAAACLNSMVGNQEWTTITRAVRQGTIKLLYLAPETLVRSEILLLLEQSNLVCLAIDEAHCISDWGHDFRPEYRQLRALRQRFPRAGCLLLTATATPQVRKDIRSLMNIAEDGEFVASFNRPNLFLSATTRQDDLAQIIQFLQKHRGEAGIIYCGKRDQVDSLCASLNAKGWPALPYHAGLEDVERRQNQERFLRDDPPLMVATIAFGMGINKSNIRFVIHAHLPKNLEGYYQEIGRAGRDSLPSECLLLYSRADAMLHSHFIDEGEISQKKGRRERLSAMLQFAGIRDCRRIPLLAYFGEQLETPCGHCDNCARKAGQQGREAVRTVDVTKAAQLLFSCIRLTGEYFGPKHIIAVLHGSASKPVLEKGHDRLPVYGAGKDYSRKQWAEMAAGLIEAGYLLEHFEYGSLILTDKAIEVLKGSDQAFIAGLDDSKTVKPAADLKEESALPVSDVLFQTLRTIRRKLAEEANMPAFYILSDRVLKELAMHQPQTPEEFLKINGIGPNKLAKYGEQFLQAIRSSGRTTPNT